MTRRTDPDEEWEGMTVDLAELERLADRAIEYDTPWEVAVTYAYLPPAMEAWIHAAKPAVVRELVRRVQRAEEALRIIAAADGEPEGSEVVIRRRDIARAALRRRPEVSREPQEPLEPERMRSVVLRMADELDRYADTVNSTAVAAIAGRLRDEARATPAPGPREAADIDVERLRAAFCDNPEACYDGAIHATQAQVVADRYRRLSGTTEPPRETCANCRHAWSLHTGRSLVPSGRPTVPGTLIGPPEARPGRGCEFLEDSHHTCPCPRWFGAAGTPEPPRETTFAWLIERGQAMGHVPPIWWTGNSWTDDASQAQRFATKAECLGQMAKMHQHPFGVAVEHGWVRGAAVTTEPPRSSVPESWREDWSDPAMDVYDAGTTEPPCDGSCHGNSCVTGCDAICHGHDAGTTEPPRDAAVVRGSKASYANGGNIAGAGTTEADDDPQPRRRRAAGPR